MVFCRGKDLHPAFERSCFLISCLCRRLADQEPPQRPVRLSRWGGGGRGGGGVGGRGGVGGGVPLRRNISAFGPGDSSPLFCRDRSRLSAHIRARFVHRSCEMPHIHYDQNRISSRFVPMPFVPIVTRAPSTPIVLTHVLNSSQLSDRMLESYNLKRIDGQTTIAAVFGNSPAFGSLIIL
jgi:hypothetical protein